MNMRNPTEIFLKYPLKANFMSPSLYICHLLCMRALARSPHALIPSPAQRDRARRSGEASHLCMFRVMTTESLVMSWECDGYQWSRENSLHSLNQIQFSLQTRGQEAGITWWMQELLQDKWLLGMTFIWSNLKIQICLKSFTVRCQSVAFCVFIKRRAVNMGSNGGVMLRDSGWAEVMWQLKH